LRTLVTSRCTLEPLVAAHAHDMFTVLSDPAIYEFENEPPISEEWLTRRYERLEQRRSPDGQETWLNWVVRLPDGELAGGVQATVLPSGAACVAYELGSLFWRQGIGSSAVTAMLAELHSEYGVNTFVAALKSANVRSLGLLRGLGFSLVHEQHVAELRRESDELVMIKSATPSVYRPAT
jgi:[ribosomal protein S5]-alanine N-acetyltransferase